jgi:cytochrome P450
MADFEAGAITTACLDMLQFVLTAVAPDANHPTFTKREHLIANTKVLTLAGPDTTTESISVLFFYLAHNHRVLAKLTAETCSTFLSLDKILLGLTLRRCVYLRVRIDEATQLNHPAPGELPREVLPGSTIVDVLSCTAGTVVGCAR